MLSTLAHRKPNVLPGYTETKTGLFVYTGTTRDFHEWEFRTMTKFLGTKDDDKPSLAGKIIEGLRDEALLVAMEMGYEKLASEDGIKVLVTKMRNHIFPYQKEEAKEFYKAGHKAGAV